MSVLFILKGYPRVSETFIAQEILALEQRGIALAIASLRRPTDTQTHPVHRDIAAEVKYLPEYLHDEPARVDQARTGARRLAGYPASRRAPVPGRFAARPILQPDPPLRPGLRVGA